MTDDLEDAQRQQQLLEGIRGEGERSTDDVLKVLLKTVEQNTAILKKLTDNEAANVPNPVAVRAEKISKLNLALRKSGKIKDFKDNQDVSVKEWIRKYESEILVLKRMSGIDDNLTSDESKLLLKDKLDHHVIKRVDTALRNENIDFNDLTYEEFTQLLKDEFGGKVADVCDVLMQFGPNRLKKSEDMSVTKFVHLWLEQLPE